MAFIVEDGTGVAGANAYATLAEVLAYLTERARQTQNSWSTAGQPAQEAAVVKATDYIENRFRSVFKGSKQHLSIDTARSTITLTAQPVDGDTVTIGAVVYTFRAAAALADEVAIGDSITESIANLVAAINLTGVELVEYGAGQVEHPDVFAAELTGLRMAVYADDSGPEGDGVATTTDIVGAAWSFAATRGGSDTGHPQPLSFPRAWLYDRDGRLVVGVPDKLKAATAEYAVRALLAELVADQEDAASAAIIAERTKVGPIETEVRYSEGAVPTPLIRAYPAADALLSEYIGSASGSVMRG